MSNSRISGLYRLSVNDRIGELVKRGFLSRDAAKALLDGAPLLPLSTADRMAENVIGVFGLPFGIAPNFLVNDKDYVVPMVVEEPSARVRIRGFGDSAINLELLCWIKRPADRGLVVHDLNYQLIKRFREEQIEIPYPQRDLHVRDLPSGNQTIGT